MKKESIKLTTAQFAKLHNVNKRTLHYYDSIGLFSPNTRKDNGYRYYDISQSIDFEYIRMLKECHMTIDEIEDYYLHPNPEQFLLLAKTKEKEIEQEIKKLKYIQKVLQTKQNQILFCDTLSDHEVRIEKSQETKIYTLPFDFSNNDISNIFSYIKDTWTLEQIRMGIGGFIHIDKILNKDFEHYDGIYTPVLSKQSSLAHTTIPKGTYLCGYHKGAWNTLHTMYESMIDYATSHSLTLTGYAYEMGLNEFAIASEDEYITKIMIQMKEKKD